MKGDGSVVELASLRDGDFLVLFAVDDEQPRANISDLADGVVSVPEPGDSVCVCKVAKLFLSV